MFENNNLVVEYFSFIVFSVFERDLQSPNIGKMSYETKVCLKKRLWKWFTPSPPKQLEKPIVCFLNSLSCLEGFPENDFFIFSTGSDK